MDRETARRLNVSSDSFLRASPVCSSIFVSTSQTKTLCGEIFAVRRPESDHSAVYPKGFFATFLSIRLEILK
jgi:hypothetical protein